MNQIRLLKMAMIVYVAAFFSQAQDNQWVTCNPSFNPTDRYPGASLSSYNGWACIKYDSCDSAILAWRMILDARRHNGIYANALVLYSVKNNRIDLVCASNYAGGTYDPAPAFTLMPEFAADTTPCPRHPYDAFVYVDSLHAAYMLLGATPRVVNFEASPSVTPRNLWDAYTLDMASTWKFDFSTRKWRRIPTSIRKFWTDYYCGACVPFHDNHLFYWKKAHKLLFIAGTGRHVATMDLATETWDTVATVNAAPFPLSSGLSAWDDKRECAVIRFREKVCRFDPTTRTWASLPDCGLDATAPTEGVYTGVAFIPKHDTYLTVGRDGTTRAYDCEKGSWSTVAQGSIGLDANDGAIYLAFDPVTDNVILSTERSGTYGGFRRFHYIPAGVGVTGDRSMADAGIPPDLIVRMHRVARFGEVSSRIQSGSPLAVSLFRANGSLVQKLRIDPVSYPIKFTLPVFTPGTYFLSITGATGTFSRRLIID